MDSSYYIYDHVTSYAFRVVHKDVHAGFHTWSQLTEGGMPTAFSTAFKIVVFKGGTTEERMAPSMSDNWMWCISRMFLK